MIRKALRVPLHSPQVAYCRRSAWRPRRRQEHHLQKWARNRVKKGFEESAAKKFLSVAIVGDRGWRTNMDDPGYSRACRGQCGRAAVGNDDLLASVLVLPAEIFDIARAEVAPEPACPRHL